MSQPYAPKWRTARELRALLDRYRAWSAVHDDRAVTALIHGHVLPETPTLVERLRALQGRRA